eukprot:UN03981
MSKKMKREPNYPSPMTKVKDVKGCADLTVRIFPLQTEIIRFGDWITREDNTGAILFRCAELKLRADPKDILCQIGDRMIKGFQSKDEVIGFLGTCKGESIKIRLLKKKTFTYRNDRSGYNT